MTSAPSDPPTNEGGRPLADRIRATGRAYGDGEPRPLRGYTAAIAAYAGLVGAITVATRLRRGEVERLTPWDVALLSVASHRLARTLTKDAIASPLRAPFTRFRGPQASGELEEEVRVDGTVGHVVGELLTCPFCATQWVATGLTAAHLLAPQAARVITSTLTAVAGADFLHYAYAKVQQA
jgi:uncharacterized protein DUF1360